MFCPKCGTQNPDDGRFCRSCGADLGNVTAALTGKLLTPQTMIDRKGKPISWESAIVKMFSGLAFLLVALYLGYTGIIGAKLWWFWLLIPAFASFGSGIAQLIQIKRLEAQTVSFAPPNMSGALDSAPSNKALSPTQTDYMEPPKQSIYDTGEFIERPPSVTEGTTRLLQIDNEAETK